MRSLSFHVPSAVCHRARARTLIPGGILAACLLLIAFPAPVAAIEHVAVDGELLTRILQRHGASARSRVEAWSDLIRASRDETELEKLRRVNDFINGIRYAEDREHWGKKDYWATPLEFLVTGAGDCEDFSIAKYVTLLQLGVPSESLKIMFVTAPQRTRPHMVLAYYPRTSADPLILDNAVSAIRLHSQRSDLRPVYSFNAHGLWMWEVNDRSVRVGSSRRVGPWRDVTMRMRRVRDI